MRPADPRSLIDESSLRLAVARLTGDDGVFLAGWHAEPIGGLGNPATAGIVRVSGSSETAGEWSLVLKQLRAPEPGDPAWFGSAETDWNFWRREALIYQSGLLDDLPSGLSAPRCYGVDATTPGRILIWLEDLGELHHPWSAADYCRAALLLGRLGAADLCKERDAPWLSRRLLHAWCDLHAGSGAHPLPHRPEPLLRLLESVPLTFCHRDAAPPNLRLRPGVDGGDELVLLDWGLCGIGPVGEDLGPLLMQAARDVPNDIAGLPPLLIGAFLDGLRSAGWTGDDRDVWAGALAAMLLRAELWQVRARQSPRGVAEDALTVLITHLANELNAQARDCGGFVTLPRGWWSCL